ncbi:fungal-specific transcription factor domain-containing protein [Mariannaea sp. PMI_226]|nr:fungal-specific transcription factor domain-containing protein [Mariannaea sp. PMI_226]
MVNIHLDTLPLNRAIASKDCPVCITRRVKCDRSLPTCVKCASRDLECLGYNPFRLRWDQGVASRGKLAGKPVPVTHENEPKGKSTSPGARDSKVPDDFLTTNCQSSSKSSSYETLYQISSETTSHPSQGLRIANRTSSAVLSEILLNHFDTKVVPRLTWIDLAENPWRHRILPLAQKSTCLRLSINSLAAAHLFVTSTEPSDQKTRFLQIQKWNRQASLSVLSQKMRNELHSGAISRRTPSNSAVIEVLAAVLTLCYMEALVPGSKYWTLHLRACRTVINLGNLEEWKNMSLSSVERFLLKEVADLETLQDISIFNKKPESNGELTLRPICDTSIWSFTELIHDITDAERRHHEALQNHQKLPVVNMDFWRKRAQDTYDAVSASTNPIFEGQGAVEECLQSVIKAHYHASLIYSYQAFVSPAEVQEILGSSIDALFHEIQSALTGSIDTFTHDLFFPCFIAGTECRSDRLRQSVIEKLFYDTLVSTGIWFNYAALQFLKTLWASSEFEMGMNWIQYARRNETQIGTFILF